MLMRARKIATPGRVAWVLGTVTLLGGALLFSPLLLAYEVGYKRSQSAPTFAEFPVTVDPRNKIIVENAEVNAFFDDAQSPLTAAAVNAGGALHALFEWVALTIGSSPWYQGVAAVDGRFVVITPGMRKEQVANAFANVLGWGPDKKKTFLTKGPYASLPLPEGSFSPGIYPVSSNITPLMAQELVNDRFSAEILARYGTTTAQVVPLSMALTIASLIEREAGGSGDRRIISGIIWNRLFINMPLQVDATLQYAKASALGGTSWWPTVVPSTDLRRKSPYNTYLHKGLPPTPIASPSVASVLAALNPINTSCLFYFHDNARRFHCSDTYAEHVALLKQYFGRGK